MSVELSATTECLKSDALPQWDLGDGSVAEGWVLEHTYLGSGDFTVRVAHEGLVRELEVSVEPSACPGLLDTSQVGSLASDELDEASGLSHSPSGVLWTHNDSGDGPRLFAMSGTGEHLGTVELAGAPSGDWEDSTRLVDPETGHVTLFVGDIGDNAGNREAVIVYVVPEPHLDGSDLVVDTWFSLELQYPDGPQNADTLMVDPATGDLYIVAAGGRLYRKMAPHISETRTTLEWVTDLPIDDPTGGDISPLGDHIAVRSRDEALLWLRDRSLPFEAAFDAEPCALALADEVRGEAIAIAADGAGYFTVSEEVHEPIWYTGFDQPCSDFEVRIERSPDGELPLSLSLGVDGSCVPAGIARVTWQLGDELLEGEEVEITLLASGEVPVLATVEDQTGQIATAETLVRVFPQSCPDVDPNLVLGTVGTGAIVEASGLAHSVGRPGVLWTHNDSGAVGDLFALDEQGVLLETVELDIHSGDWEDLAYGWTAAGDWTLFVGDVGDNAEAREHIRVYLVPEEDPQSYGEMELRYPGGLSHNCESITLDPVSGDLLVITKDYAGDTQVFVKPSPHLNGDKAELVWLADLDTGAAPYSGSAATTAADFSPLGNLLAVRTYTDVWLFRRDQSESLEAIFEREPCDGLAPGEQQGESIAFATDGSGYFLLSEGQNQPLNFVPLD